MVWTWWWWWWREKFQALAGTQTHNHPAHSPAPYHSAILALDISIHTKFKHTGLKNLGHFCILDYCGSFWYFIYEMAELVVGICMDRGNRTGGSRLGPAIFLQLLTVTFPITLCFKQVFFKIYFDVIVPCTPRFPKWYISFRIFDQNFVCISQFPMRDTCPTHLTFIDLSILRICGEEYKL
jgi:hypothetical protein